MDQTHTSPTHSSSYFPSCMASPPSWLVLHRPSNPSRFHLLARGDAAQRQQRRAPSWRRLLDRLVREGRRACAGACARPSPSSPSDTTPPATPRTSTTAAAPTAPQVPPGGRRRRSVARRSMLG
uniref:Uncharacterized protein n=1 Tax=Ananas comosus var. bracteatus TaxID=296719 RepID=A0A6V7PTX4_ANACO|nr:unnamed protein product [Ananas comosus var. bracteatus]